MNPLPETQAASAAQRPGRATPQPLRASPSHRNPHQTAGSVAPVNARPSTHFHLVRPLEIDVPEAADFALNGRNSRIQLGDAPGVVPG